MKTVLLMGFLLLSTAVMSQESQEPKKPCSHENYKQFNFWLGDWETFNPDGSLAGTNNIVQMQGNCVIQENWTSANAGYSGTSYNFYDGLTNTWTQVWVDNQGGNLHLTGGLVDGKMILKSEKVKTAQGKEITNKVTWTPNKDGSVRQLWETTEDGEEWTVAFDGLYKLKKTIE